MPETVGGELKKNDPDPDDDAEGDERDPLPEIDFCRILSDDVDGIEDAGDDGLPRLAFSCLNRSMVSLLAFSKTGRFLNVNEPKSISFGGSLDRLSRRRV